MILLYFEKLYGQENFLYHHNDHLHSTFTNVVNINSFYFAYNSILCSAVYVQNVYMVNNLVNICVNYKDKSNYSSCIFTRGLIN